MPIEIRKLDDDEIDDNCIEDHCEFCGEPESECICDDEDDDEMSPDDPDFFDMFDYDD